MWTVLIILQRTSRIHNYSSEILIASIQRFKKKQIRTRHAHYAYRKIITNRHVVCYFFFGGGVAKNKLQGSCLCPLAKGPWFVWGALSIVNRTDEVKRHIISVFTRLNSDLIDRFYSVKFGRAWRSYFYHLTNGGDRYSNSRKPRPKCPATEIDWHGVSDSRKLWEINAGSVLTIRPTDTIYWQLRRISSGGI